MRLLLRGGGSGGHVFPALAVAQALQRCAPEDVELLYVGRETGVEASITHDAQIPFRAVASRPVRGRFLVSKVLALLTIMAGVWESIGVMRRFRPSVVLVTGGYVSVPVGVAAWITRRPLVLFLPDIEPGWAVRFLARLATRICVSSEASLLRIPKRKAVVTGYPLRPIFSELDRPMARARFQLNGDPALLIAGAVQGARRLNDAVSDNLEAILEVAQVIHLSGRADYKRLEQRHAALPPALQRRYQVTEYLGDDLPIAMAGCDLAVSRAGASVLGEYPAAELPSVLVPLPQAGGHQRHNAEVLERAGAAVILDDADVPHNFLPTILTLLHDPDRLAGMRRAAAQIAQRDAAQGIARVLWEVQR